MDIVFSSSFCVSYPDLLTDMHQLLLKQDALDLLRPVSDGDTLPRQKTIRWSLSKERVQFVLPNVDIETVGIIWVEAKEVDDLNLHVMLGEFVVARPKRLQRRLVFVVGVESGEAQSQVMSRMASLEMRMKVHIMMFETSEAALKEVYRLSVVLTLPSWASDESLLAYVADTSFCSIVQPDFPVAASKHRAQYMSILL
ncbi:hypothetical protein V5O48_013469 [Marasmius crinis-equi]|uniref:Uncharacterized protein n=1 Tax=Marasmius crinis-equi TaxID=585013 RepID=A0ABR3EZY8_9AGAR